MSATLRNWARRPSVAGCTLSRLTPCPPARAPNLFRRPLQEEHQAQEQQRQGQEEQALGLACVPTPGSLSERLRGSLAHNATLFIRFKRC